MIIKKSNMPILYSLQQSAYKDTNTLPSAFQYRGHEVGTFFIPTEMVIYTPEIVTPKQGRYWPVDMFLYLDSVYLPREDIIKRPMLDKKIWMCTQAYIIEHWVNNGCDGHISYHHDGYALVPSIKEVERFHGFQVDRNSKSYEREYYERQRYY